MFPGRHTLTPTANPTKLRISKSKSGGSGKYLANLVRGGPKQAVLGSPTREIVTVKYGVVA